MKDDDIQPNDEKQFINSLLSDSIEQYKELIVSDNTTKPSDIEHLQNIVSEYLDDFIIIGHTTDDKRIAIRYAPTARGYDGLIELSRNFLIQHLMNGD